nr:uncharacterized mitochondrial protein AtMg00810-like [Tanacetum cinerariifolium]
MDSCGPMRIGSINGKRALCYPKNDREDIGKLGAKGDIGFFIGYSADSCAYRVFNQRTKKIMETMNVSFDELSAMGFEQRSLKPELQSMTSGQISSGLDLTYAPSTITTQQPTKVRQTPTSSTSIADTTPTPRNSSSQATNFSNTSQDVDELNSQQQHVQQQGNQAPIQLKIVSDNVPNAMFDANTFVNPFATPSTIKEGTIWVKASTKAWYDELSMFLLQNHFFKGTTDPTLFITHFVNDIFVAKPTEKHLKEVKRIFRYLQGTVNTGLWYTKDFGFELTGFPDADEGCKDTFKSTSGGAQFLGEKLDQTMALQPYSSRVKIQDLMLNQQRYFQDESLFYQSLPQISDIQALSQKNMFNKTDDQYSGLGALDKDDDIVNLIKYVSEHKGIEGNNEIDNEGDNDMGNDESSDGDNEIDTDMSCDEIRSYHSIEMVADMGDAIESEHSGAEEELSDHDDDNIVDEEHIIDELEVNMEGFKFSVDDDLVLDTLHLEVNVTENDLKVIDFDFFNSDIGDDSDSKRRAALRKLKKEGKNVAHSRIENYFFVGQEFPNKEEAKI